MDTQLHPLVITSCMKHFSLFVASGLSPHYSFLDVFPVLCSQGGGRMIIIKSVYCLATLYQAEGCQKGCLCRECKNYGDLTLSPARLDLIF